MIHRGGLGNYRTAGGIGAPVVIRQAVSSFNPLSVGTPRAWWSADGTLWQDRARTTPAAAHGDIVRAVDDKSANGVNLNMPDDDGTVYLRIINGVKVLYFAGGAASRFRSDAFVLFPSKRGCILSSFAIPSNGMPLATYSQSDNQMATWVGITDAAPINKWWDGSWKTAAAQDVANRWYVQQWYRTGDAEMQFYRDAALTDTLTINDVQQSNLGVAVGGAWASASLTGAYFRDILIYDVLADADRQTVQNWMIGRKGLTTLLCFGDSITYGTGASDAAHSYAGLLAANKGMTLVNAGLSNTILQNSNQSTYAPAGNQPATNNGRDTYTTRVTPYVPSYFVCLYGLNDLRVVDAGLTTADFQNDLGEVVDGVVAAGTPASRIILCSPPYVKTGAYADGETGRTRHAAYQAAVSAVAAAKGCKFADVYDYMTDNGGDALVGEDNIHPNDDGHAAIATCIEAAW